MRRFFLSLSVVCTVAFSACDKERVKEDPLITEGRTLFNDTKFDLAGKSSCGTCHPGGDMDNKKWLLPTFTESLATPTLFGVSDTPPYGWTRNGVNDIRTFSRFVIETIWGSTATGHELDALVAYQASLRIPSNPSLYNENMNSAQLRGKNVFENQGQCSACHSGTNLTGNFKVRIHPVNKVIDVPSLRWIFATSPYFHDHSKPTLRSVVDYYADSISTAQMTNWLWNGGTKVTPKAIFDITLTEQERIDLVEFLKTL